MMPFYHAPPITSALRRVDEARHFLWEAAAQDVMLEFHVR